MRTEVAGEVAGEDATIQDAENRVATVKTLVFPRIIDAGVITEANDQRDSSNNHQVTEHSSSQMLR